MNRRVITLCLGIAVVAGPALRAEESWRQIVPPPGEGSRTHRRGRWP
jgi:hypothetical protein